MITSTITLLTFSLQELRFAIPVEQVKQIIRAVEVTPVPDTHDIIQGVIDVHGELVPVINLRERFRLPNIHLIPDQRFIIVHAPERPLALVVDEVLEVITVDREELTAPSLPPSDKAHPPTANRELSLPGFLHHDRSVTLLYDVEVIMNADIVLHLHKMDQELSYHAADER